MTIYEAMRLAGVPMSNHESDLYVPVNARTTGILLTFPIHFQNATRFVDHSTRSHDLMYEIPFAFDPFWHRDSVSR